MTKVTFEQFSARMKQDALLAKLRREYDDQNWRTNHFPSKKGDRIADRIAKETGKLAAMDLELGPEAVEQIRRYRASTDMWCGTCGSDFQKNCHDGPKPVLPHPDRMARMGYRP